MNLPPLTLYVHLPWCLRKCPYCDFNSHAVKGDLPGDEYIDCLLLDLERELPLVWGRPVHSIFFGGGTPSLFSAKQFERFISGCRGVLQLTPDAEITLEANPGTVEHDSFSAYRDAGINRVSLGVQSFNDDSLARLGRIHGRSEALRAVESIKTAGIDNFNIDLMFALPGQSRVDALLDIRQAIDCGPAHLSHYQLTIEPNTEFHAHRPRLPGEDLAWEMQEACSDLLANAGFEQYEISAWARSGKPCRHNLNYWRYGDYIGIGAGAHGKITLPSVQEIRRRIRHRSPGAWMQEALAGGSLAEDRALGQEERVFEFFLNQLRLRQGVNRAQFSGRTGVAWQDVSGRVDDAIDKGLLREQDGLLAPTDLGWRFVNETQAIFLP